MKGRYGRVGRGGWEWGKRTTGRGKVEGEGRGKEGKGSGGWGKGKGSDGGVGKKVGRGVQAGWRGRKSEGLRKNW